MAKILVVDDQAVNRELVVTLIKHRGHLPIEAVDGIEALALVRAERPELVISDILMPTMDGYEFVRQLRSDPAIAATEVIFYSAHYREREARNLARATGVTRVLIKPCEPEDILQAIDEALAHAPQSKAAPPTQEFDREHLRVMTDKLSEKVAEVEGAHARLAALTDLNLQLASERDSNVLLEKVCRSARDLIGATYAVLCVNARNNGERAFFTSGIESSLAVKLQRPEIDCGLFGSALADRHSRRITNPGGDATAAGFPPGFPPLHSALVAPVISLSHAYGWICLADKLGAAEFSDEDEQIMSILAAQVGRIYENGSLYRELQRQTEKLREEIVERKRAEVGLRESEAKYRTFVESASDAILVSDARGRLVEVNAAGCRMLGYSREELLTMSNTDIVDFAEAARVAPAMAQLSAGEVIRSEWHCRRKDGTLFPCETSATVLPDGRLMGIMRDITERRRAEQALRESEARLNEAQRNARIGSWCYKADGTLIWSDQMYELFSFSRQSPISDAAMVAVTHPEDIAGRHHNVFMNALAAGASDFDTEYRIVWPEGRVFTVHSSGKIHRDLLGQFVEATGTVQDVSERVRLEGALREREAGLYRAQLIAKITHVITGPDGSFESWPESLPQLIGVEPVRMIKSTRAWLDILHPEDRAIFRAKCIDAGRTGRRTDVEYRLRRGDGGWINVNQVMDPLEGHANGEYRWFNTIQDVTEQKMVEEALRTGELQQRRLAEQLEIERFRLVAAQRVAKVGSWETDLTSMSVIWSDETHRIHETDPVTFSPSHQSFLEIVHPADRVIVDNAFNRSLGQQGTSTIEHRLLLPDGRIKFVEERWNVLRDKQDMPQRAIGTCHDITDRKLAEDEIIRLNADLERTVEERTAELERANQELKAFDYSVSHDLKAPIRHIDGFSEIMIREYSDKLDARGRDFLQRMQSASKRMEQMVGDLLSLSLVSRSELNRLKVDMSALALQVFGDLQRAEPERDIEYLVVPGLTASADHGLLRHVLENLIGNARKFTAGRSGAKIEFGAAAGEGDPTFFVRDNGAGFNAAFADRLFAPFQRLHTQNEFKGTGIGLATVSRIITRHGGKVWAEGAVGQGATIYFTLPA